MVMMVMAHTLFPEAGMEPHMLQEAEELVRK